MTKRKPTKHEDDVRRGLRTAQYNGIIDTQLAEIARLKAEAVNLKEVIADLRISAEDDLHSIEAARIENARLKAEFNRLKNTDPNSISGSTIMSDPAWSIACFRFHRENERAEIARLRKAGDELERVLISRSGSYEAGNASHEWRAAKEGKSV